MVMVASEIETIMSVLAVFLVGGVSGWWLRSLLSARELENKLDSVPLSVRNAFIVAHNELWHYKPKSNPLDDYGPQGKFLNRE